MSFQEAEPKKLLATGQVLAGEGEGGHPNGNGNACTKRPQKSELIYGPGDGAAINRFRG